MAVTKPADRSTLSTRLRPFVHLSGLLVLTFVLLLPVQAGLAAVPTAPSHAAPMAVTPGHPASVAPPTMPASLQTAALQRVNAALHPGTALSLGTIGKLPVTSAQSGAPASVRPDPSTSTNFAVPGSDCAGWGLQLFVPFIGGENVVTVGASGNALLAAGGSLNNMFNGTGGVFCNVVSPTPQFYGYGASATWRSTDGGVTWTEALIPRNVTHWQTPSDPTFGSISTGSAVVAAGGQHAQAITGYGPACIVNPFINCTGGPGLQAPWGWAISSSSDSGVTWSNATQLDQEIAIKYLNFASGCAAFGLTPGYYVNNLPERPWIVSDGLNAVAGWDVFHENWNLTACSRSSQAFVQTVYTTDGGVTWNGPLNISNPVSDSIGLAMGPASTHTTYAVFADFANATASGYPYALVKSTNHGATWTTETDLGPAFVNPSSPTATYPASFATAQYPVLAADNTSGSHSGSLYLVWQDNQTGSYAGYSAIGYLRSTNGGTSWGAISYLTPATTNLVFVQPAIAVGPDGTVWVTYYGVSLATGNYQLYGIYSTDGGTTWSHQFQVSDTASSPGTTVHDIGFYTGIAPVMGGMAAIWSDCRQTACAQSGDVSDLTAWVGASNITTNAPGSVSVSVTVFGSTTSYALGASVGWDSGASITAQAPATLPYNATYIDGFSTWAGVSTSSNFRTTFTYSGTGNLTALYSPVPAAFFAGNITPVVAGTVLTLDGNPVTLTQTSSAYTYNVGVASGQSYWLNVTAPLYNTINRQVAAIGGQTIYVNYALTKQTGTITGTLTPVNASLTLDDLPVNAAVNLTTKIFNLVVPWGPHWLNASLTGYTTASAYVTVTAGGVVTHNFILTGGWISGTVKSATSGLVVTVDGNAVTTVVGTFNVSVPGGFHVLVATQPGYNTSTIANIAVQAGHTSFVNVTLTNHGWIAGTISPTAALSKSLELSATSGTQGGPQQFNPTTGAYNLSLLGGQDWTITVTATGYNTSTHVVTVVPGAVATLNIALNASSTGCTGPNCNNPPPTGGGNSSSNGIPLTTVIIIVVVIVAVAAVLMVVMMRRGRGGGGGDMGGEAPEQTYEESNPSDLPKLQSDGSMGPGNP